MEQLEELIQTTRRRLENALACPMLYEGVERTCLPIIQHSYLLRGKQLLWTVTLPPIALLGVDYKRGSAFSLDTWANFTQSSPSFHELLLIPSSVSTKLSYRVVQPNLVEKSSYDQVATVNYDSNHYYQNGEDFPFPVVFTFRQDTEPVAPAQPTGTGDTPEDDDNASDSERSTVAIRTDDIQAENASEPTTDSLGNRLFHTGLKTVGTAAALLTGQMWIPNFIHTEPIKPLIKRPTYKRKRSRRDTVRSSTHSSSNDHFANNELSDEVSSDEEDSIMGLTAEHIEFNPPSKRLKKETL